MSNNSIGQKDPSIIYRTEEKITSNTPYNPFLSEDSSPKNKDIICLDTPENSEEDISIKENLNNSNERALLKAGLTTKETLEENNNNINTEKEDQIPSPKNTEELFDMVAKNKKEEKEEKNWFNRDGRNEKDEYAENHLKKIIEDHKKIVELKKDISISISELESIQFNMYYVKVYSKEPPILLKDKLRPRIKFDNLKNVPEVLRQNLKFLQYEYLTPVQRVIMPYIQYGKDIVCVTETGSGKTLSYLFSIVGQMLIQGVPNNPYLKENETNESNNEDKNNKNKDFEKIVAYPICLIIVPSRELALQISKESKLLTQNTGIRTVEIVGGDKALHQLIELSKGCDILVCTPMRIQYYLKIGKIDLKMVKYLVLDEADKMLSFEFYYQLKGIFDKLPKKKFRQNLLFSATLDDEVKGIANYCLNNYYYFNSIKECPKTIKHMFFYCKETEDKFDKLLSFLKDKENRNKSILIFLNNKSGVDEMMKSLQDENIKACSIHGGKTALDRNRAIRDFSLGNKKILVSTDLISRGLDFPNIYCVINFDVPYTIEDYIHRIGRTGRLGQKGLAITYLDRIDDTNKENLINLLNNLGQEIPSWINDVEYQRKNNFLENKKENFSKNDVNERNNNNNEINNDFNENENSKNNNYNNRRNDNNWNDNRRNNFDNDNNNNYNQRGMNRNNNNYRNNYRKDRGNQNNNWDSNNRNNNRNNRNHNNFNNINKNDEWSNNTNKKDSWNNNNEWNNNTNKKDNWNNNNDEWNNFSNNNNEWNNDNTNKNNEWNNDTNKNNEWNSDSNKKDNWNNNNGWNNENTNKNNEWNKDNWNNNNNGWNTEKTNKNSEWNSDSNNNNEWNSNSNKNNEWNNDNKNKNNEWNNNNNNNNNKEVPEDAYEELFIRGINYNSEENDLRNTFSKYGEVVHCKILKDKETNKSKGIGFVTFKEKYQAYTAMKDAGNIECQGRKLKLNYANNRNRDNPTGNKNNNFERNKNRNFEKKRNNNFSNKNNKEENNNENSQWNEKINERERSREKVINVEDIDAW